jgi:hypothetical protein
MPSEPTTTVYAKLVHLDRTNQLQMLEVYCESKLILPDIHSTHVYICNSKFVLNYYLREYYCYLDVHMCSHIENSTQRYLMRLNYEIHCTANIHYITVMMHNYRYIRDVICFFSPVYRGG